MMQAVNALIERQIPQEHRSNPELYRKSRLALMIALVTFLLSVGYAPLFFLLYGSPVGAVAIVVAAVHTAFSLVIYRRTYSARAVGHNITAVFLWIITFLAVMSGGVQSPVVVWLLLPPLLSVLLCGKRAGQMWTACIVLVGIVCGIAQMLGVQFPTLYNTERQMLYATSAFPVAVFVVYLFATMFEEGKNQALAGAEAARKKAEQATSDLTEAYDDVEFQQRMMQQMAQSAAKERDDLAASIETMLHTIETLADGDLTVRLSDERDDDIGKLSRSLNTTIENFQTILQRVTVAMDRTIQMSSQISSDTARLLRGMQEQTSRMIQIAGSMEEMTTTIDDTTQTTSRVANEASQASDDARQGGSIVSTTIAGMSSIANVVVESATTIQKLNASSEQIGDIARTIEEIADQTNLLALNAAIEAARAGEQGRGFAVVADEVRKLAERTQQATREISVMLKHIQSDTTKAVHAMMQGQDEVERGKESATSAVRAIEHIIARTSSVANLVSQVAAASTEQSSASNDIASNLDSIGFVTAQATESMKSLSTAADGLNSLINDLQSLILQFKVGKPQAAANLQNGTTTVAQLRA